MMNVLENVLSALPLSGLVLVGVLGIVTVVLVVLRRGAGPRIERKAFLTRAEIEVLGYLQLALPAHHVSRQVSMGALLKPQRGLSRKEFWRTRNRFGQKIVDFVAIDPETGSVEAVIELDDASHDAEKDRARDALLALGQYRVIRIPSKPRPTEAIVREATASLRAPRRRAVSLGHRA
jgi:very-short-patch-repair endonuclease